MIWKYQTWKERKGLCGFYSQKLKETNFVQRNQLKPYNLMLCLSVNTLSGKMMIQRISVNDGNFLDKSVLKYFLFSRIKLSVAIFNYYCYVNKPQSR